MQFTLQKHWIRPGCDHTPWRMWRASPLELFIATAPTLRSRKNATLLTGGCRHWRFVSSQHCGLLLVCTGEKKKHQAVDVLSRTNNSWMKSYYTAALLATTNQWEVDSEGKKKKTLCPTLSTYCHPGYLKRGWLSPQRMALDLLAGLKSACLVRWSLRGGYVCVHCWAIWQGLVASKWI